METIPLSSQENTLEKIKIHFPRNKIITSNKLLEEKNTNAYKKIKFRHKLTHKELKCR